MSLDRACGPADSDDLSRLYSDRFRDSGRQRRDAIWGVLCPWFERWIPSEATVLDLAAGHCEFINNVSAGRRIALDVKPDVKRYAKDGVEAVVSDATDMAAIQPGSVDVVFVSNFFEHLTRGDILATLAEVRRILALGGRLLVLQPNIRYCAKDFWMFFDHITPLDHHSLAEALGLEGFVVQTMVRRFLPYTTKGRLPARPWMVRAYLRMPLAWRVLGAQTFIVAVPSPMAPVRRA